MLQCWKRGEIQSVRGPCEKRRDRIFSSSAASPQSELSSPVLRADFVVEVASVVDDAVDQTGNELVLLHEVLEARLLHKFQGLGVALYAGGSPLQGFHLVFRVAQRDDASSS